MPTTKDFKLEELSKYFHLPEKAVAKELGICLTSLKKICRSYGITRWPFRKLKSIQRTLAKDDAHGGNCSVINHVLKSPHRVSNDVAMATAASMNPGMATIAQIGPPIVSPAGASAGPAASGGNSAIPVKVALPMPPAANVAQAAAAAAAQNGTQGAAREIKVHITAVEVGEQAAAQSAGGGGSSRGGITKRRKPYQLNGRTVMLTEEEKSIYELTLSGQGRAQLKASLPAAVPQAPLQSVSATAAAAGPAHAKPSNGRDASSARSSHGLGNEAYETASNASSQASLWTREHLEKRLLEPLGGLSLSISQAELICRAAAAAAEKNLKGNKSHSLSLSASRSSSPAATSDKSLGSQASQGPESDSRRLRLNLIIPQSGAGGSHGKLSSLSDGASPSGLGGFSKLKSPSEGQSGTSPVFKHTPATPPTSFTNYLFESTGAFDSSLAFGALMMPTSSLAGPSMGLSSLPFDSNDFSDHPLSTMGASCVEVGSSSMQTWGTEGGTGPAEDMTSALVAPGTSMSGSQLAEDMEPSSLPIPLSLIISDVISSGGGGMGGGDANYARSPTTNYARSPLSSLLSSALAPPASSPGGLLKSPKSPLLLVVSPGTGPVRGMSPLVDCSPPTSLNTCAVPKSPAEKKHDSK